MPRINTPELPKKVIEAFAKIAGAEGRSSRQQLKKLVEAALENHGYDKETGRKKTVEA